MAQECERPAPCEGPPQKIPSALVPTTQPRRLVPLRRRPAPQPRACTAPSLLVLCGLSGRRGGAGGPGDMPATLLASGMTAGKPRPQGGLQIQSALPGGPGPTPGEQVQKHTWDITLCPHCPHPLGRPQPLQAGAGAAGTRFRGQLGAGNPTWAPPDSRARSGQELRRCQVLVPGPGGQSARDVGGVAGGASLWHVSRMDMWPGPCSHAGFNPRVRCKDGLNPGTQKGPSGRHSDPLASLPGAMLGPPGRQEQGVRHGHRGRVGVQGRAWPGVRFASSCV